MKKALLHSHKLKQYKGIRMKDALAEFYIAVNLL